MEVQPGVLVFCDDPDVKKAVTSAVDMFNERLTAGYKLAYYQMLSASKVERLQKRMWLCARNFMTCDFHYYLMRL